MACRRSRVRAPYRSIKFGSLAQLVERLHGMQEVKGSSPLSIHRKQASGVIGSITGSKPDG